MLEGKRLLQLAQDLRSERKSEFLRGYDCGLGLLGLEMCGWKGSRC